MPGREKRLRDARQNPKNVTFNELCSLIRSFGGEIRAGKGSHFVAKMPGSSKKMTIPRKNPMKAYYVKRAIQMIDELSADFDQGD